MASCWIGTSRARAGRMSNWSFGPREAWSQESSATSITQTWGATAWRSRPFAPARIRRRRSKLTGGIRLFARAGWNDGRNESFAYTEVDNTVLLGGDVAGERWHRTLDRIGI